MTALIIVDMQNDFLPGGNLAVPAGSEIIVPINKLQRLFDVVVATQDWHPLNHNSFASNHPEKKIFEEIRCGDTKQTLWPTHCVQGSPGAAIHAGVNMDRVAAIFRKGMDASIDSYSAFYDNGHQKSTGLAGYLRDLKTDGVFICGLAADFCVYYTAKDAIMENFPTTIIEDATRPIDKNNFEKAKKEILSLGGRIMATGTRYLR